MKKKNKRKKGNPTHRIIRQMKGLSISWQDKEPWKETEHIVPGDVTHTNPLLRHSARALYRQFCDSFAESYALQWVVSIVVVFIYDNGVEQREERELFARCKILQLNSHCLEAIEDALRHGENYSHTEFNVRCVGV